MKKLLAIVLVVIGCSPAPTTVDAGTGGGAVGAGGGAPLAGGTAGGSSGGVAGGTAGGAAGGSAGGSTAGPTRSGTVTVGQSTLEVAGQTFRSGGVFAGFVEAPAGTPLCTSTVMGACTLTTCGAAADAGTPADAGQVGAGTLTVTGLADGGLTLTGGVNGYAQSIAGPVFVAGALVSVAASGGAVPAFTAQVTAPGAATLTAPACPSRICPALSRAAGVPVSWTGGTGTVVVQVLAGTDQVLCQFPASSGAGMVPAAALASLPLGSGSLLFSTQNSRSVQAGLFPVTVTAAELNYFQATLAP
ncbi:MAG: hypothetical protein INH41_19805 [Myxococcaceae bacterium]|jgi:hypothetical protein|nr:hypothetical protein [Myxococcaceae bacterium]